MARFLLKESRFIRQLGEQEPRYVTADVDHPVIITLAEDHRPDNRLVPVADDTPLGPWVGPDLPRVVPAFAVVSTPAVPTAAQLQGRRKGE